MNIPQIERQIRRLDGGTEYLEFMKGISPDKFISIDQIINAVCEAFNVKESELFSKRRLPEYVEPRRMICFLNSYYGVMTLQQLGRKLGMDHTSIIYHRNKIKEFIFIHDLQVMSNFNKCREIIENETAIISGRGTNERIYQGEICQ